MTESIEGIPMGATSWFSTEMPLSGHKNCSSSTVMFSPIIANLVLVDSQGIPLARAQGAQQIQVTSEIGIPCVFFVYIHREVIIFILNKTIEENRFFSDFYFHFLLLSKELSPCGTCTRLLSWGEVVEEKVLTADPPEVRTGKRWNAEEEVDKAMSNLSHSDIVGAVQSE